MLLRRSPPNPSLHNLLFPRLPLSSKADAIVPSPHDSWLAKVISTAFLLSPSSSAALRLTSFRKVLTPSIAFDTISRLENPKSALEFFELTRSSFQLKHLIDVYRLLIRMLCQSGLPDEARKVFDQMSIDGHPPESLDFEFLANSFARAGELGAAMDFLGRAFEYGCGVSSFVYNNIISLLLMKNRAHEAVRFFNEHLSSRSFNPDTCTFNIVIRGLCRLGDIDKAFEFFTTMGKVGCPPDTITHNILIDGFCRANQTDRGHEILRGLWNNGFGSPNVVSYTSVISGYCKIRKMEEAFCVFNEMVYFGIRPNIVTYNVLIDGYGKVGDMTSALSLFQKMITCGCSPDIVTFTSLIDGYCRSGRVDDAMKLWCELEEKKLCPNAYTFAVVINALCKENRLCEARILLTELKGRRDIVARPFMYNPVIDGFCKAGNVEAANLILVEMEEKRCFPDKLTYTILIIGHCMKGRMSEAIDLFHKMITTGCLPDNITVSSLISCLLKAGMPNEANQIRLCLDLSALRKIPTSLRKCMDISAVA